MMQRAAFRVGKNAAALLASRVGMLLLGLWLNGQLTRAVGVAGLGRYLLALTVEGITLAVANAGLNLYATREFSRSDARGTAMMLGLVLSLKTLIALVATLLLAGVVAPLFFPGQRRLPITLASLALLPQALNGGMEALLKGRQRMELSSMIEVTGRLAAVAGGLVWLSHGGDERHVLICYVAGHMLATAAYGGVLASWHIRPHWGGWRARAGAALRQALPFAGADVVATLYRRVDLLLLSSWYGDVAVGIYGAAYRLWETLGVLPASLLDALFPELARQPATPAGYARLRHIYRRAALALLVLVVVVGGLVFWLAPHGMRLVYGEVAGVEQATHVFRVLTLALPLTYLYLLNGHVLYAVGEQRRVLVAMALVTVGNALLNAVLIPRWSYWGAVTVALLAEGALLLLLGAAAWQLVLKRPLISGRAG